MIEIKLNIFKSDGYLCASGVDVGIHTYAKTWNKLMKNISDAIDLYLGISSCNEVRILLAIEPQDSECLLSE